MRKTAQTKKRQPPPPLPQFAIDKANEHQAGLVANGQLDTAKWSCGDGVLIDWVKKCNGREDCADGSDEKDCPNVERALKRLLVAALKRNKMASIGLHGK